MNRALLSPSIMCVSHWSDARQLIEELKSAGAGLIHADVMDGEFVPNLMLGTESIKQLRKISCLPLDIHLMIGRPDEKLDWFDLQPGEYVSVHVEAALHLQRVLSKIKGYGAKPMAALNPGTPLCMIEDVLDDVDGILLMTVNPGFAGQALIPRTLDKITRLRKLLDETGHKGVRIEVDGNVSFENAVKMRAAGADVFVGGTSSIFSRSGTITENTRRLWNCIYQL